MKQPETELPIQKHLFDLLFLIKERMKDVIQDVDDGLSPLQILILRTLVEEGDMPQARLVQIIGKDKSQVTRLVQELEAKQLLTKERHENDRRSFILKSAKEVKNKVSYFIQQEQVMVTEMLSDISQKDQHKLDNLLIQMQENLRKNG